MTSDRYVAVIGGISVDLHATPVADGFDSRTSTPSRVELTAGGVGRNIAANLAVLGVPVRLFGATGDDPFSDYALRQTTDAGVDVRGVRRLESTQGGIYIALLDRQGELQVAAADLSVIESLGVDFIEAHRETIAGAALAVAETNLSRAALQRIVTVTEAAGVPLIVDPVSNRKAERLQGLSGTLFAVTPNEEELPHCGIAAPGETPSEGLRPRHTILTRGSRGLRWTDHETGSTRELAAVEAEQIDATGAGDAFVAGFAGALFRGEGVESALEEGTKTAARVVASRASTLEPK
ncbi:MAG: PfkB family carbohydrate kinase [Spirochaetota bacterium]